MKSVKNIQFVIEEQPPRYEGARQMWALVAVLCDSESETIERVIPVNLYHTKEDALRALDLKWGRLGVNSFM